MKGAKPKLGLVVPMKGERTEAPAAPDWMTVDGRAVWDRLAPELYRRQRLEAHFHELFVGYCEEVAIYMAMTKDIAENGISYETGAGRNGNQLRQRPEVSIRKAALDQMMRLSALFGFSPVDEKRLATGGQGDLLDLLEQAVCGASA